MAIHDDVIAALEQLNIEATDESEELEDMTVAWGRSWCRNSI